MAPPINFQRISSGLRSRRNGKEGFKRRQTCEEKISQVQGPKRSGRGKKKPFIEAKSEQFKRCPAAATRIKTTHGRTRHPEQRGRSDGQDVGRQDSRKDCWR